MKGPLKHILFVFLLLSICLACKKEMPVRSGFELSATTEGNTVILNWPPIKIGGFKSISVYRSNSPIPTPQLNYPIDAGLLIATITDITKTSFCDSNIVIDHSGTLFYRVVLNLSDRIIPSNEEQLNSEGFSIHFMGNGLHNINMVTAFPEQNLLYLVNTGSGALGIVDYSKKKLIEITSISSTYFRFDPVMNDGKPEVFMRKTNTMISCYDGLTFLLKYNVSIPSGYIRSYKVKDDFMHILYVDNNIYKIRTYDLSNQIVLGDKTVYFSPNIMTYDILATSQSNSLFVKCLTSSYDTLAGYSVYKSHFLKYNLVNQLPADSTVISSPALDHESIYGNDYYYIESSSMGNYLLSNSFGDILELSNNSVHNVKSGNNSSTRVVFSQTENYLMSRPGSGVAGNSYDLIDIYRLPGFNLIASEKSPNSIKAILKDDFLDNDSLVSYNLINTLSNNQLVTRLTFYFKRLD